MYSNEMEELKKRNEELEDKLESCREIISVLWLGVIINLVGFIVSYLWAISLKDKIMFFKYNETTLDYLGFVVIYKELIMI